MSLAVMLVLASTFGLAAVMKLRHRASFQRVLAALAGDAAARTLVLVVPAGELALAATLLAGAQPRAVALATLAVLLVFSWTLVRLREQPQIPSCNCFGTSASDPAGGLARNAALSVLAVALVIAPHGGAAWSHPFADVVAAATVSLGAVCAWQLAAALAPARRALPR